MPNLNRMLVGTRLAIDFHEKDMFDNPDETLNMNTTTFKSDNKTN